VGGLFIYDKQTVPIKTGCFKEDNMNFNQMMIHYCAPTLCNIKPANLFFVQNKIFSKTRLATWKEDFLRRGIMLFSLALSETSTAILALNICWTRKILGDSFVKSYLTNKGYIAGETFDFVEELFSRMHEKNSFPHEVGVILGYPVYDVIEFENHHGHDCKYRGYWKSYSDVENAKRCLCKYKECSCLCKNWYDEGYSLNQIVNKYRKIAAA